MDFAHFRGQVVAVQEAENRARKVIERLADLCKRVGGRVEASEDELNYEVTCTLPERTHIFVLARKNSGLYMELENAVTGGWIEDFGKDEVPSARELMVTPGKGGKITQTHVKIDDRLVDTYSNEGYVSGYFKKMQVRVAKNFNGLWVFLK